MRNAAKRVLLASALVLVAACGREDPLVTASPAESQPVAVEDPEPIPMLPRWKRSSPTTAIAEKVVLDGLEWLARHQDADGSWSVESASKRCSGGKSCFDAELEATHNYDEGLTALALLAFLDAGFTHESKHEFGNVVKNGLNWLKKGQKPDGSFCRERTFLYSESLATAALAEAFGRTQNRYWREPAQKGVNFLQAAQRPNPSGSGLWGWRYASRQDLEAYMRHSGGAAATNQLYDADTSNTASCVLALKRAHDAGLQVESRSMYGALEFCKFATGKDGLVGYIDAKSAGATVTGPFDERFTYHPVVMSALGMCIRLFTERDFEDPFLGLGARRVFGDLPQVSEDRASIDYYYWFYGTLALQEFDGKVSPKRTGRFWPPWSKAILQAIPSIQTHSDHDCSDGGWLANDRWSSYSGVGAIYNTAMSVRTLAAVFNVRSTRPPNHPLFGKPAPEFEAVEEPSPKFRLSELKGRVVLIDFLAPSSRGFEMDLKARASFARGIKDERVTIITVCLDEAGVGSLPSIHDRAGLPWICLLAADAKDPILQAYGINEFPTTIVVDDGGIVRGVHSSWDDVAVLARFQLAMAARKARPK